jgi:hypothetical protein
MTFAEITETLSKIRYRPAWRIYSHRDPALGPRLTIECFEEVEPHGLPILLTHTCSLTDPAPAGPLELVKLVEGILNDIALAQVTHWLKYDGRPVAKMERLPVENCEAAL